jgi:hypothetical protein
LKASGVAVGWLCSDCFLFAPLLSEERKELNKTDNDTKADHLNDSNGYQHRKETFIRRCKWYSVYSRLVLVIGVPSSAISFWSFVVVGKKWPNNEMAHHSSFQYQS